MKNNVTRPGGLHTDNSPIDQPKNTTRFVLNGVDETSEGESNLISNEEGNEVCYQLTSGYIPLGEVNIGDGNRAVFSVAEDESSSEIGIIDRECTYTPVINADFGFRIGHQIDATYRLRRGCERTVYWVDPKPRVINLDGIEDYKDENGDFVISKFNLVKTTSKIPVFKSFEVGEQGQVPAGSVNFAVQYLDEDFNPTEWLATSDTIKIYHDNVSENYSDIRGSTNRKSDYQDFGVTNKSVRIELDNLDRNFPFFRVAIIRADNGSGAVTSVEYSPEMSIDNPIYNYTGQGTIIGTVEEIQQFATIIDSAQHIEQLDNKLILSDVKGKQIDFCKLQKYASRIKSDVVFKKVNLSEISESNPKSPLSAIEGTGYMPGEIESFGIVYVFDDGSTSPVYHIPGKNPGYPSKMSTDNVLQDVRYTDNSSCDDYWGTDSEGESLSGKPVRHHRFPLRSEVNKPLFSKETTSRETTQPTEGSNDSDPRDDQPANQPVVIYVRPSSNTTGPIESVVHFKENGEIKQVTISQQGGEEIKGYTITLATDGELIKIMENGINLGGYSNSKIQGHRGYSYHKASPSRSQSWEDLVESTIRLDSGEQQRDVGGIENERAARDGSNVETEQYATEIFGIEFSGVEVPDETELNGHKVIGYYIVKNERTEEHKTILDTGIITPLTEEEYFVAHGHLAPEFQDTTNNIKKDAFGLIHPEHKFLGREYKNTSEIIQEGEFLLSRRHSRLLVSDVQAGSSYDPEVHDNDEADNDGFSMHLLVRDSSTTYQSKHEVFLDEENLKEIFYLDSLSSKSVTDTDNRRKEIFNVSGDNKVGIITSNKQKNLDGSTLPYVILKRNLASPYGNFRYLPYHKQSKNIVLFKEGEETSSTQVFGGDTYVGPMRYSNSFYYNTLPLNRKQKSSFWNYVVGGLAVVAGTVLALTGVGTALGIMVAGFGLTQLAAGVTKDKVKKVYNQLFDEGLRDCVDDDFTRKYFPDPETKGKTDGRNGGYMVHDQDDDEIEWVGETVSHLWFESGVNIALRQGVTAGIPDFLNAPRNLEVREIYRNGRGEGYSDGTATMTGRRDVSSPSQAKLVTGQAENMLQDYFLDKLTVLDPDAQNGRLYQGFANAEFYDINEDFLRKNKEKIFNHLGIEYDCCSDCNEEFPHRTHWSETSFQEELTDNYRVFLPNNYRDLEGENGRITNVFKIQNNLYLHTEEALYHLPQNVQERVTGDILSFIGTGEFFNIPPRKIVDSDQSSAGTRHKWGTIKTKYGVLFPSVDDRKWYMFNGNGLDPITDMGMSTWFNKHMPFKLEEQWYSANGTNYPYRNNPSSPYGIGYLSTYDTEKERLIITKKDFTINPELLASGDFDVTQTGRGPVIFRNRTQTIDGYRSSGYSYEGIEKGRMKFSKTIMERVLEKRQSTTIVPASADIHVFYDTSGSFGAMSGADLQSIKSAVLAWEAQFRIDNPGWTGDIYHHEDRTERWLGYAGDIAASTYSGENLAEKDIIVLSFCNESSAGTLGYNYGNDIGEIISSPSQNYLDDFDDFKVIHSQYSSFIGIHYPIVFESGTYSGQGRALLQHSLAALKGRSYTQAEVDEIERNYTVPNQKWTTLKNSLKGNNPYPDDGLENYGWVGKWNRNNIGEIINASDFANDINGLLESVENTELVEVEVLRPKTVYDYVSGERIDDFVEHDNSWTMSFSLKRKQWRSWHSYTPNFYFTAPGRFHSWIHGNDHIWRHNVRGLYHTFYGQYHPYVLEYVSVSNPIQNRIWDSFMFQTSAYRYADNMFIDDRLTTFNKLLLSNSRQVSGELNLLVKDTHDEAMDYMEQQISNNIDEIIIDNNEGDWYVNGFRDMRGDNTLPMFKDDIASLNNSYYTDKVLNDAAINFEKDWSEMESFRDKYLSIRLIFDTFDNIKLVTNYSVETEDVSQR